jgi:hypothetical protein
MALQKTINLKSGIEVAPAYIRVEKVELYKGKVTFNLGSWKDGAQDALEPAVIESFIFDYNIDGENPIKQAYQHLKTLPEFADATDV